MPRKGRKTLALRHIPRTLYPPEIPLSQLPPEKQHRRRTFQEPQTLAKLKTPCYSRNSMTFLVECWNPKCRHRFHAQDELVADHDYLCPRCGKRAAKIIFTRKQIERHIPYRHIGSGEIVQAGIERRALRHQGYWIIDPKTRQPQEYDMGIPRF